MALGLLINGEAVLLEVSAAISIAELVAQRQLRADRVAIERNGEIVSREAWASTTLQEGDRLEIVHFVGGGVDVR